MPAEDHRLTHSVMSAAVIRTPNPRLNVRPAGQLKLRRFLPEAPVKGGDTDASSRPSLPRRQ